MSTPNQMPQKSNKLRQQLLSSLIETKDASWNRKVLGKDADGKETVHNVKQKRDGLRFPLAGNLSEDAVERLAQRWIK